MKYIISILLTLSVFSANAQTTTVGAPATGTTWIKSKIKVTYYGAGDTVLLMVKPSDSTMIGVSKDYFASTAYVDSLYNTIGTHDSLVKYSDSLNNIYVTGYRLDTAKANLRISIATKLSAADTIGQFVRNQTGYQENTNFHTTTGKIGNVKAYTGRKWVLRGDSRSTYNIAIDSAKMWFTQVARQFGAALTNLSISGDALCSTPFNATSGWNTRSSILAQSSYPSDSIYFTLNLGTNEIIYNQLSVVPWSDTLDMYMSYVNNTKGIPASRCYVMTVGYIAQFYNFGHGSANEARVQLFNDSIISKAAQHGWTVIDNYNWEKNRGAAQLLNPSDGLHETESAQFVVADLVISRLNIPVNANTNYAFAVNGTLAANKIVLQNPDTARPWEERFTVITDSGKLALASNQPIMNNRTTAPQSAKVFVVDSIKTKSSIKSDSNINAGLHITAGWNVSGLGLRATGSIVSTGLTGAGGEMSYESGAFLLWSRNRTTSADLPMQLRSSHLIFGDADFYTGYPFSFYGGAGIAGTLEVFTKVLSPYYVSQHTPQGAITDSLVVLDPSDQKFKRLFPASGLTNMSPTMPNKKFVGVATQTAATGDLDLYTCPAGKRALVHNIFHYNASAGNITVYYQIKVSGTYYRLTTFTTPATNTSANHAPTIILEAGESIAVNTTTNTGLNIQAAILEFDNTSNLKTKKILGTSTGDNLVYTCPANTNAMIAPLFLPTGTSNNNINFMPDGGGARTYYWNDVLSGGSTSAANKIVQAVSPSANTRSSLNITLGFNSGDFLNLNVDAGNAAQIAWINIMELPN